MISKTTILVVVIGVLVLGAAGYLLFGQNSAPGVTATENTPATSAELTFIGLTAKIDPVEFDTSILKDPRFIALHDIRTAVVPEQAGRFDPFAPLGK
jgi:hypothetical protein